MSAEAIRLGLESGLTCVEYLARWPIGKKVAEVVAGHQDNMRAALRSLDEAPSDLTLEEGMALLVEAHPKYSLDLNICLCREPGESRLRYTSMYSFESYKWRPGGRSEKSLRECVDLTLAALAVEKQ